MAVVALVSCVGATAIAQQLPLAAQAPVGAPLTTPILATGNGGGVFPVFGDAATFSDTYGAPRAGTGWHHGEDIFAPTGTPVLAVADGEISSVGVNTLGGNRLWLRDAGGTTYYYAHLSAYAPGVVDGALARAGQLIGFVGNTGQAITTPPHLHFEIHPGDGPSIDPTPMLRLWRTGESSGGAQGGDTRPARARGAVLVGVGRPAPRPAESATGRAVAVR